MCTPRASRPTTREPSTLYEILRSRAFAAPVHGAHRFVVAHSGAQGWTDPPLMDRIIANYATEAIELNREIARKR
jgi:hypothetical protein